MSREKQRKQWNKTLEEGLPIKESERQSVRQIMSRLRSSADTGLEIRPVQPSTVSEIRPVQNLDPSTDKKKVGYVKVPNDVLDEILPSLSPIEAVVFLRLYRLSHGFNRTRCTVGSLALRNSCNVSEQTCRVTLRRLIDLGLIRQVEVHNSKQMKGTTYEILTGLKNRPVQNLDRSKNKTGPGIRPNTSDDLYRTDNHHSETMRIYQSITKNEWKKGDNEAYARIKHIPVEIIEQGIQIASQRATSRPNSLAYFVKEILNQANPSEQSRAQKKRALEKVIEAVRAIHVGEQGYTFPDFIEDVKRRCAKDGVCFDNDLFNEIVD